MPSRIALVALVALLASVAHAETRRVAPEPVSLRTLCIDAPAIVLARPVDPLTPTRFQVSSVLRGDGLRLGDTISPQGLEPSSVRTYDEPDLAEKKSRPRHVSLALLFLSRTDDGKAWQLLRGGLRFCTDDGKQLAPSRVGGQLVVQPDVRWPLVVARVRQDVAAVDQVNAYRRLGRPRRRVQALLGWVSERKGEFAGQPGGTDEAPVGWGRLQMDVFDWIFASADPEVAWRTMRLYAELNHGDLPRLPVATFSTPGGRALLTSVACDARLLLGERTRALTLLGQRVTMWPTHQECQRGAVAIDRKEQESLLDRLASLLSEKNDSFRIALAVPLVALSQPPTASLPRTDKVVPALVEAYRDSLPGPGRDDLSCAVCALVPAARWKELTNNPPGVCVNLRDLQRKETRLTFWLSLRAPSGQLVYECPTLVVERLGTLGFVAETKKFPLKVLNLPEGWPLGWNGDDALVTEVEMGTLTASSNYRVRVEGFVGKGKDRVAWRSEPRKFHLPAQRPGHRPGYPYPYAK